VWSKSKIYQQSNIDGKNVVEYNEKKKTFIKFSCAPVSGIECVF
jgi:hypothetical protein